MACRDIKDLFTPYLDGVLPGAQAQTVARHLRDCNWCNAEFTQLRSAQSLVASLGRRQPPAELALRLRIAVARERSRDAQPLGFRLDWHPALDRMREALRAIMLPATAGVVSAVFCFAVLIGFFALPAQLSAANDIPSGLFVRAQLLSEPFSVEDNCGPDSPVMVEVSVDSDGRVDDYQILSDEPATEIPRLRPQLDNALLFARFRPAMSFGKPAPSRVILQFSRISVKA